MKEIIDMYFRLKPDGTRYGSRKVKEVEHKLRKAGYKRTKCGPTEHDYIWDHKDSMDSVRVNYKYGLFEDQFAWRKQKFIRAKEIKNKPGVRVLPLRIKVDPRTENINF